MHTAQATGLAANSTISSDLLKLSQIHMPTQSHNGTLVNADSMLNAEHKVLDAFLPKDTRNLVYASDTFAEAL